MWKFLYHTHPHPRDQHITFKDKGHIYTIYGSSENTISSTSIIKLYTRPFPGKFICQRMVNSKDFPNKPKHADYVQYCVDEHGQPVSTDIVVERILQHWKRTGAEACSLGTALHDTIDRYYNSVTDFTFDDTPELRLFQDFDQHYQQLGYEPYRTEWLIYDELDGICGAIDCVMFRTTDQTYHIFDWKRSKRLQHTGGRMLPPLQHLKDCNYIKYSLQLNLYKYILERHYDIPITSMKLVMLHPVQTTFEVVTVPNLQDDIRSMIHAYRERKSTKKIVDLFPLPMTRQIRDFFPESSVRILEYFPSSRHCTQ